MANQTQTAEEISRKPLRDRLVESERIMKETGCYDGVEQLHLRDDDPLKYEMLHTKLRSFCVSAREMARRISASPGVRENGEMVVALYTPEGDAVALSNGIMVHVHTTSRFIKWMIENGYEDDPGIREGDVFANNDAFIGTLQCPDVMDVVPIFHEGELVGWVGAVCHELEVGGITPGGDVALAQERYTEGMFVCAERVGENDELRRDYLIRCERNLRMPIYWILDEKAKIAACLEIREQVKDLIDEIGVDYYRQACREFIEEGRRVQLARMRQLTVPGRYRGHTFYGHVTEGKPGLQKLGPPNFLYAMPMEMTVDGSGHIHVDFDGTQPWGYHSMNCTPGGMDGGMFVTLTQHMNYEGRVNDGAWHATSLNIPEGTWTNPDTIHCATATAWALLLPAYGVFQRMLSRGFLARGFNEEVFVGQVNSPMIEMGGESQYGDRFGAAHFECAAAGSGALAIKDGLDTAYVGWNPESDMGSIEIWEQSMPVLYLGRSITADSGGIGKHRGGVGFTSTWLVHRTSELTMVTSEHSARVFDNGGMCGGYPAPTVQLHHVMRESDVQQRVHDRDPIPHSLGSDPYTTDVERLTSGDYEVVEGPYISAPLKDGDIFTHSYNGGGGYGDPLERDPASVLSDVENGYVTADAARRCFAVAIDKTAGNGHWQLDPESTEQLRKARRQARLKTAIPVAEWIARERPRVASSDFVKEVRVMYRDSFRMSPRFADEFREFWGLSENFEPGGEQ